MSKALPLYYDKYGNRVNTWYRGEAPKKKSPDPVGTTAQWKFVPKSDAAMVNWLEKFKNR